MFVFNKMNIEKPISTIRKAIIGSAEEAASKESLSRPEQRHYDYVFGLYKQIRDANPELLKKIIIAAAKGKELKDEIGQESEKVFNQVWGELAVTYHDELVKSMKSSSDKFKREIFKIGEISKNDPRIISAFSGKEDALNKCIDYANKTILDLFKDTI